MGKSDQQMLDALSKIVGIRSEHYQVLSAYGARLFERREALAKDLYWYLLKHQDDRSVIDQLAARVEVLLHAFEQMLQCVDGQVQGDGVLGLAHKQYGEEKDPSWLGGLAECFLQHMLAEIAAMPEPRVVKDVLEEALRKRVSLELMSQMQEEPDPVSQVTPARMYATLSGVSLALIRSQTREQLFQSICRICVEQGGFAFAWIGWINETRILEHAAMAGEGAETFVPTIEIDLDIDSPSSRAVSTLQQQVVDDAQNAPDLTRWAAQMKLAGIRSLLVTPLVLSGDAVGTLVLYARKTGYFDADTVGLVQAMAREVSHALERQDAIDRSQRAETELSYLIQHDPLTGLPNRQLMLERISHLVAQPQKSGKVAVVTLAIDGFHELNARLGHDLGDIVLREVALRMGQIVQGSGTVGRVGAARFVACSDRFEPVDHLVAKLTNAMRMPIQCMGEAVSLKCSVGIVLDDGGQSDASTLLRCSDLALIRARDAGGGQWRYYDEAMDEEIQRLHKLRSEFSQALAHGELELFYQPKINLLDRKISGVEALVRWRRDGRHMAPGEFFPAIEHTDLMRELDWWVMGEALRHSSVWMAQGKLIPVSVNLSAMTLRHESFLPRIQALIMRHPLPDGHLELEVLENVSQKEAEEIIHKLERCREFGVSIALDDFGTGASSLVHLQQLPFDTIKIDQRFVRMLLKAPGNEAIIRSMISFAHYTGRKLVVEGVESQPIWDRLLEIGCSSGQGYAISPPVSSAQLMSWIAKQELGDLDDEDLLVA
jgi:diguanylate cyclase (GGDEF)-like protein